MPRLTYLEAYVRAVRNEMRRDPRVFVMGQDVESLLYGDFGLAEFGSERVRNTPISEAGFFGAGIGSAMTGMRPVIQGGAATFLYSAMDQIVSQAAKSRYMFGGQVSIPIVIIASASYTAASSAHHSDRPWAMFAQVPGLKIVLPTTPYDAKGLMTAALRDGNPILFFTDGTLVGRRDEVPEDDYVVPIGTAEIKRVGTDVTLVALGSCVHHGLKAAKKLEEEGLSLEVIDLRSIVPMDRETILASVMKTGRLIVADPAPGTCSVASEVAALVAERAFDNLKAPVVRLTAPDIPVPFSPVLERLMYPTSDQVISAARMLRGYKPSQPGVLSHV